MRDIYLPKAKFLIDALGEDALFANRKKLRRLRCRFRLFSSQQCGNWDGRVQLATKVSEVQAELANEMVGNSAVLAHDLFDIANLARTVDARVVSMIGILEHLQEPLEVLAALRDNPQVRYLFISVPLFSPCVFIEMAFPAVMQRQLTAGHTHLFTSSSLDWICGEFGMKRAAEWWFGTDIVDLFRSIAVTLGQSEDLVGATDLWNKMFVPAIDDCKWHLIAASWHRKSTCCFDLDRDRRFSERNSGPILSVIHIRPEPTYLFSRAG